MPIVIKLNKNDNVAVSCERLKKGDIVLEKILILQEIDLAHKIAIQKIRCGEKIIKYGVSIGSATKDINEGEHVHTHNIKSDYIKHKIC